MSFDLERFSVDLSLVVPLDPSCWETCENISIDYTVIENPDKLVAVRLLVHLSDLGDWTSVWAENLKDEKGNVNLGEPTLIACT